MSEKKERLAYQVELVVFPEAGDAHPGKWDWHTLLDSVDPPWLQKVVRVRVLDEEAYTVEPIDPNHNHRGEEDGSP